MPEVTVLHFLPPARGHGRAHATLQVGSGYAQAVREHRATAFRGEEGPSWLSAVLIDTRCHNGLLVSLRSGIDWLPPSARFTIWHTSNNAQWWNRSLSVDATFRSARDRVVLSPFQVEAWGSTDIADIYKPSYWYQAFVTSPDFWRCGGTSRSVAL